MNIELFNQLLIAMTDSQWQQLANGMNLTLLNDQEFLIDSDISNCIVNSEQLAASGIADIKGYVMQNAGELLHNYYLSNPLSQTGFNWQVKQLFNKIGIENFVAHDFQPAAHSLFVEGSKVIAEDTSSPRHAYGVYFTAENEEDDTKQQAIDWVDSGEAYEVYLSMNVCRYNC